MLDLRDVNHGHLYCGLGGGARGFNKGSARVGNMQGRFVCVGGIDVDAASIRDFERLSGVAGTVMDLFSLEQYRAFHGREPPPSWREKLPADVRGAFTRRPHIIFLSAPCKGFSGLLSETQSLTDKYQALNQLTVRGLWLLLEAYADDPVELIVFENVPRIATRGRPLIDQIIRLLRQYGYVVAETTHDCGELGGLGQSRKRFLLVARHAAKVPPYLYEPPKRRLRGVGEILEQLPLPGDIAAAGPMHRMPALQWKTWVRLALVKAGSDWRSLKDYRVEDGFLVDYGIMPDRIWHDGALGVLDWREHSGTVTAGAEATSGRFNVADPRFSSGREGSGPLGVNSWAEHSGTITANGRPAAGAFSVADPRVDGHHKSVQMGVRRWGQPAAVVKGDVSVGTGPYAVADPRQGLDGRFNNIFRVVPFGGPSPAVSGPGGAGGGLAVADPRGGPTRHVNGKFRITGYEQPANAVIAASTTGNGAFAVADPRPYKEAEQLHGKHHMTPWDAPSRTVIAGRENGATAVADPRPDFARDGREVYLTQGHYGVTPWEGTSRAVTASGQHDNGSWSVADPRPDHIVDASDVAGLPNAGDRLVALIRAQDDTWHRPFTTLELAALQSLFDPEEMFSLDGQSDSGWRERIGNAVPSDAAAAIASEMGRTLLLAWSGETFRLCSDPIWVQPNLGLQIALSVDVPSLEAVP